MGQVTEYVGRGLARFLTKPVRQSIQVATISQEKLAAALQPGDVLLVEGNTRVSVAIKYLTQSTWSHAQPCTSAMYCLPTLPGSFRRY